MAEDNFREVYGYATTLGEAESSAKTQAKRIERAKKSVEITMPGTNAIIAGMHVNLAGFREGISGRYKIVTVRQTISRAGWTTSITGEGA